MDVRKQQAMKNKRIGKRIRSAGRGAGCSVTEGRLHWRSDI